ncbi:hypothetical protein KKA47_01285, partial [bacterium]|nr:hypothetical protein [bacterium]
MKTIFTKIFCATLLLCIIHPLTISADTCSGKTSPCCLVTKTGTSEAYGSLTYFSHNAGANCKSIVISNSLSGTITVNLPVYISNKQKLYGNPAVTVKMSSSPLNVSDDAVIVVAGSTQSLSGDGESIIENIVVDGNKKVNYGIRVISDSNDINFIKATNLKTGGSGIRVDGDENILAGSGTNDFTSGVDNGIRIHGNNNSVEDFLFENLSGYGVYIYGSHNQIGGVGAENTFKNNGNGGIRIVYGDFNKVSE